MKRSIAIVLMVILALFLFVACDDGKASDSYCTVSFDPNGGSGSMTPQTVKQGVPTPLSFNGFTRKGSVFRCWNTKADGSGDSYTDNSLITAKAYTRLYAQWLDEVTVSFDANGGTGEMPGQTLYDGIPSPLAANGFRREGYGFKGWKTQADGKGTDYTDEEVI
ncbi:MAG: InlB B-repeat-containing protein, partial [Spirochaetales bacterium]|nr:InlB B-repeat-containing protein [Spirochaetales bacterium]